MTTKWFTEADSMLQGEQRKAGRFVLCAWPDGFWAIDIGHRRVGCCSSVEPSLDDAKAACESALRNLLAEAVDELGEAP